MNTTIFYTSAAKPNKINLKTIFFDTLFTLAIFFVMAMIIASPKTYTEGTVSGLKLFFFSVLPGLFPFMLLTKLLTELGTLFAVCKRCDRFSYAVFGTPGVSLYAFFMSIISGYPIGAKIISDLYQKNLISKNDAKKMCLFCTTSGPIFVIGTVGTIMFGSYKVGLILYFSHIISSIFMGVIYNTFCKIFRKKSKNTSNFNNFNTNLQFLRQENIMGKCVNDTIESLFVVGAYITIFYLIAELFSCIGMLDAMCRLLLPVFKIFGLSLTHVKGFVYGLIEVTRGAKFLAGLGGKYAVVITSGILSFSGLSIIFQSMAFLKSAKIKTQTFVISKFVHCLLSMLICLAIIAIIEV